MILYARSLHDYTLGLWTETRRLAEERCRAQQLEASSMPSSPGEDRTKLKNKINLINRFRVPVNRLLRFRLLAGLLAIHLLGVAHWHASGLVFIRSDLSRRRGVYLSLSSKPPVYWKGASGVKYLGSG